MREKICQECGNSFKTYKKDVKYCSRSCYEAGRVIKIIGSKKCRQCNQDMHPRTKNDYKKIFCSQKCRVEYEKLNLRQVSNEIKQKISNSLKGNENAKNHIGSKYWLGKKKSIESVEAMKNKLKNRPSKKKGIKISNEIKQKISNSLKGREDTQQTKANKRRAQVERSKKLLEKYDLDKLHFPNFNPKACDYFEKFDKKNNTHGCHALNGGEYYIKELGYFVDYINHDLKIIIEWDESHHFDSSGNLLKKDQIRQNEIEGYFSDYEFRRIKQ